MILFELDHFGSIIAVATATLKLPNRRRIVFSDGRHCGLCPALGGRERAVLGGELPKSRDRLLDPGIGHVGQWDRLAVEYARVGSYGNLGPRPSSPLMPVVSFAGRLAQDP